MKRSTVIVLIVAFVSLAAGVVLMSLGISQVAGDGVSIIDRITGSHRHNDKDEAPYNTSTVDFTQQVTGVQVNVAGIDVCFERSADNACHVIYPESDILDWSIYVENGTLFVEEKQAMPWLSEQLAFGFDSVRIRIAVPATVTSISADTTSGYVWVPEGLTLDRLALDLTSGDAQVNADVQWLEISVTSGETLITDATLGEVIFDSTSGDLEMVRVSAASLVANTSSGEIELTKTVFSGNVTVDTTSGDVQMERGDGASFDIDTTSGDVELSLLSGKQFQAYATSGDIMVPPSTGTDLCRIDTTSGDIHVLVVGG